MNFDWKEKRTHLEVTAGLCRASFHKDPAFTHCGKEAEKWHLYITYYPRIYPDRDYDIEIRWPMRTMPIFEDALAKAEEILQQEWSNLPEI